MTSTDGTAIAKATGAFAFDLLQRLPSTENVFFSPASIAVALGMTALGARGETLAGFEKVLHVPRELGLERFHAALGAPGGAEVLRAANRLFGQRGFAFRAAFKEAVARVYRGALEELDFKSAGARETINAWVARETKDMIKDLIKPPLPTADTRLVLVNAVHFKATWMEPFDPKATRDAPFHVSPSKQVTVKLMEKTESFEHASSETGDLVALPYREGNRFEALFLLPKKGMAAPLSSSELDALRKQARRQRVSVQVPRFNLAWGKDVAPTLGAMGLEVALSPQADFSGMADEPGEPLYVGAVIHRAVVDLDEVGTEAAAATAVMARAGGMPQKPVVFRADRPFFFAIRDTVTGSIVFLGRVTDPSG